MNIRSSTANSSRAELPLITLAARTLPQPHGELVSSLRLPMSDVSDPHV